jgi:hypothetical protein
VPLIVDIVDVHPMYRGQWKKRLTYYKACAYSLKTEGMGERVGEVVGGEVVGGEVVGGEVVGGEVVTKVKRGGPMFID